MITTAGLPGSKRYFPSEMKPCGNGGATRSFTVTIFLPVALSIDTGALVARFSCSP